MTIPIWVFDLDDTLADTSPRAHLNLRLQDAGDGWIPYSMAAGDDLPIQTMIDLAAGAPCEVWIVTGRTVLAQTLTRRWLYQHGVPYTNLLMRADGDHRPNVELKLARLQWLTDLGCKVELWVDDYDAVCQAMEAAGIPSLHYRAGGKT